MGQQEKVATSLAGTVGEEIGASLTSVDAELARRYPGDPGTRQPVHTVYVPADDFTATTIRTWGDRALAALDEHAPDAASLASVLGLPQDLAEPVHDRVRAKLEREPVEDLRIDFEDGYGPRPDAEEDEAAARAARLVAEAYAERHRGPVHGHPDEVHGGRRTRPGHPHHGHLPHRPDARGRAPRRARPDAAQGDLPRTGHRLRTAAGGLRGDPRAARRAPRVRDPDRDQPVDPGGRRHRRRGPHDRRRPGPGDRTALRDLRLQRLRRRQPGLPGERPSRRRPRQGRHAGRRRRYRRAGLRRLHERAAGRTRPAGPRGLAPAPRPDPPRPGPRLLPGLGHAPGASAHPLRRRLRLLPRGPRPGRVPARRLCGQGRMGTSWTSPPPPRRSAAICSAASTAGPWTPPRSRSSPV